MDSFVSQPPAAGIYHGYPGDVSSEGSAPARRDGPVYILSNRLPFTVQRTRGGLERKPSAGGLVSALEPVLQKRGGTWIGWPGIELRRGEHLPAARSAYRVVPVSLTETEVTRYYHGFSNRTLWPLFHSFLDRTAFDRRDWGSYERVNHRFAEAAARGAEEAGLVWIHDYHLMLAPGELRTLAPQARIAFFLHIPFPPYDIFRLLPWDREILRGLMAADVVGFHVEGYAGNFLDCVEKRLGARVDRRLGLVEYGDRTVRVGAFPLGIDFDRFEQQARKGAPSRETTAERVVLGVDRLDYTKGIPERLLAFERLLELHPRHRGRVVLLQLAVPSRSQVSDYRNLKREIDELVGRINGRFATASWSPIRYLYRAMPQERLTVLYRDSDVALVTPLRDGMNLVAKEYVVCQVADPGVLVLSRLAGASETMHEAIQVNPYNIDGTAEGLHRALTMEEPERRSRMAALRRRERRYDVHRWVERFLDESGDESSSLAPLTEREIEGWLQQFLKNYRLALFLDYDGTLTPLVDHPDDAVLSQEMRAIVERCSRREDTDVSIVSGRALAQVREMVGDPNLSYAGNHGLEIEGPGIESYSHEDLPHYRDRITGLAETLKEICVDGAWCEPKGHTLTWHYRAVDKGKQPDLVERARTIIREEGFISREAHCAVEARPPIGWDKGRAVLHILRARYGPAWPEAVRVIYIGDDETDEDAFRLLAGMASTFRVGPTDRLTRADRRLANVEAVAAVLDWLAARPPATP